MNNNEIQLPISELRNAIAGLGKIVARSSHLPVLQHVKLANDSNGNIILIGTDLDAFVSYRFKCGQLATNPMLLPFAELAKIVKACSANENIRILPAPQDQVLLVHSNGNTTVQGRLTTLPVSDWPEQAAEARTFIPLEQDLRRNILQAFECSSHDETRYVINGVYLDLNDKKQHYVVATDGRHLYSANSFRLPLGESLIVPNLKFLAWSGFAEDGDWKMAVLPAEKKDTPVKVQFQSDHWNVTVKTVDGMYPNWKQCVPNSDGKKTKIEFSRESVDLIARAVPRMPGGESANKPVGLGMRNGYLVLLARNEHRDPWTEIPVPGVEITGKPVTIRLNRELLLKALDFGLTTLEIDDELSPMKFRAQGRQMVVMPVQTDPVAKRPQPATQPIPAAPSPTGEAKPVTQPQPTQTPERKQPMPKPETTIPAEPQSQNGSILSTAMSQIEQIKDKLREAIRGLTELEATIKAAQKEQKLTEKEVESVRTTIKSLQKVQL